MVLLCGLSLKLADATAIVAAVFPDAIYIAADSRLTKTSAATGSTVLSEGCKIVQTPGIALAVSALSSDSRTGFDFGEIAKSAIAATDGPLNVRLDAMEAALAPGMKAAIEGIRADFPEVYEAFRKGKVGEAVFASWEDGRPILIEEDWKITPEGGIRHERFRATEEQNLLVIGSGADAVLRYVNRNEDWWKAPAAEALEHLIGAAIEDAAATHANDVGGAIALLAIEASGQKWVKPGKCGDTPGR